MPYFERDTCKKGMLIRKVVVSNDFIWRIMIQARTLSSKYVSRSLLARLPRFLTRWSARLSLIFSYTVPFAMKGTLVIVLHSPQRHWKNYGNHHDNTHLCIMLVYVRYMCYLEYVHCSVLHFLCLLCWM